MNMWAFRLYQQITPRQKTQRRSMFVDGGEIESAYENKYA
jgi:hypothetical protein